ncbi:hypothetical protein [Lichenibacterium ramalinae]|uniref:Uncharacterized protein n=1 Tax=Lichenibacterium ramalinae TaxID=2316527 RepID=A0A4Q2R9D7_9HYPH|nr:hypothetical protein [Lichenibacterium ramalinae]RYB01448.1 hypothetical protein D3272_26110 [Lichenibacterium ramalinae]
MASVLQMTPPQMAKLLDAALSMPDPLSYLDGTVSLFKVFGRNADANAAAWIGCLYAEGEIEVLMSLRWEWRRGRHKSPAEAANAVIALHP